MSVNVHQWEIFREDESSGRRSPLGRIEADTMSDALERAAQFYECDSGELVAVQVPGLLSSEDEATETYNLLKPYLDEMWVEGLDIKPLSLEAFYRHKGSRVEYSYRVLDAAIKVWRAFRELEAAVRNQF